MNRTILASSSDLRRRRLADRAFGALCVGFTLLGLLALPLLLVQATKEGLPWLDLQFLTSFPSRFPANAGINSALWGTVWLGGLTASIAIPIGIAAALYLEEYPRGGRLADLIEINIANLAGVPSIVYGMLGLVIFVRALALQRSLIAGALTLSLLILPVIIVASREAIRAVPRSLREAAYALGATRWQVVRDHVLPAAAPGIMTGVILAMSRALGETAPLVMIGALTFVAFTPAGPLDEFTALPVQIFNWVSRPQPQFHDLAAAAIVVLLAIILLMNAAAILVRNRAQRRRKW